MPAHGRPRYRYVGFRVAPAGALSRGDLVARVRKDAALRGVSEGEPWLTRWDGEWGILRVRHTHQAEAVALLRELRGVTVQTVGASGTIRALVDRHLPHGVEEGGNKWRAEERRRDRRAQEAPRGGARGGPRAAAAERRPAPQAPGATERDTPSKGRRKPRPEVVAQQG